jgi:hypothetical protein
MSFHRSRDGCLHVWDENDLLHPIRSLDPTSSAWVNDMFLLRDQGKLILVSDDRECGAFSCTDCSVFSYLLFRCISRARVLHWPSLRDCIDVGPAALARERSRQAEFKSPPPRLDTKKLISSPPSAVSAASPKCVTAWIHPSKFVAWFRFSFC